MFDFTETPHRRWNALTGEWVLVSPHRTKRPWQGQVEKPAPENAPQYDPKCYLCPGNERAGGVRNPQYSETFVFENDFAALLPNTPPDSSEDGLLRAETESGECRVLCFSPRHDLTLARLGQQGIRTVVDLWVDQFRELDQHPDLNYVQIFENRGAMMGASNPHPHGQIWASRGVPNEVQKESVQQRAYFEQHGRSLLSAYCEREIALNVRVVASNDHFVALVPFWAVWPFETMVVSRRHVPSLLDLTGEERDGLADVLRRLVTRYDNMFEMSFPYSAGFHQRPKGQHPYWHLHMHFYPPLLRSATVKKFMVGYEMLGMPQRDITPEAAADRLRSISDTHYTERI